MGTPSTFKYMVCQYILYTVYIQYTYTRREGLTFSSGKIGPTFINWDKVGHLSKHMTLHKIWTKHILITQPVGKILKNILKQKGKRKEITVATSRMWKATGAQMSVMMSSFILTSWVSVCLLKIFSNPNKHYRINIIIIRLLSRKSTQFLRHFQIGYEEFL